MNQVISDQARLQLYAAALQKLRRKENTIGRIQFLMENPSLVNEADMDMLRDTEGRTTWRLFRKYPEIERSFREYNDSPEKILSRLIRFTRQAWPHIQDGNEFFPNWHLDVLASEYEEIYYGTNDRLLVNQPPGTMKPIAEFESVMTQSGPKMLRDISVGDMVLTHLGRFRKVTAVHDQGEIDVLSVTMNSARTVVAAGDHPFLTTRGWVNAEDIIPNMDYCGVPVIKEKMVPEKVMSDEEARLLGYLVGDGCVKYNASYSFTSADMDSVADFIRCAASLGFYARDAGPKSKSVKTHTVTLRSTEERWNTKRNGEPTVKLWLKSHHLHGACSYTKFIPKAVFCGGESAIKNFLAAYFSSDGHIGVRHHGKKTIMAAKCSTVSKQLADDVLQAMWMVGISTRVRRKLKNLKTKRQGDTFLSYETLSESRNEVRKIADLPGLLMRKKTAGDRAFVDKFERNIWEDQVVDVKPHGTAQCRCLTVEEDSSFVVNGIAVHNSMLLNVFFPAWVWAQDPTKRFAHYSYTDVLPKQQKEIFLKLINSAWYTKRFRKFSIVSDSDGEGLVNSRGGTRFGGGVGGALTGMHPHYLLIDDAIKATDVSSEKMARRVLRWFASSVATRGMLQRMAIIVCGQRLATNDIFGALLGEMSGGASDMPDSLVEEINTNDWRHACLPMRFDPDHRYRWDKDIRTIKGELLWPTKITHEDIANRMRLMELDPEQANVPAQFDQDPLSKSGTQFENLRAALIRFEDLPEKLVHGMALRAWDRANTANAGDWTAGVLGVEYEGIKYVVNRIKFQKADTDRDMLIKKVAIADKHRWDNYRAANEVNPGPDGKPAHNALAQAMAAEGILCMSQATTKDKRQRAVPFASGIKYGYVRILDGQDWTEDFLNELKLFPAGANDDQVDAGAHMVNAINDWKAGKV